MVLKKWFMRQYWRLQQSQTLISMVFWCTTLTLLIWPYVSWRFTGECLDAFCFHDSTFGISATYWGLASIAFFVVVVVLLIGYVYDQFLALWKEQRTVDTERNPFGTYALIPANIIMLGQINELLRRQAPEDDEIQQTCDWVNDWLKWCGGQEIWARSQKVWDVELSGPVPPLVFLPDETIENARGMADQIKD